VIHGNSGGRFLMVRHAGKAAARAKRIAVKVPAGPP